MADFDPLIPPAWNDDRHRSVDVRTELNGVLYVLETDCQWRHLPKHIPPRSAVHSYLHLWAWDGTLKSIHYGFCKRVRVKEGREASPTAAMVDSQSVRAVVKGGQRTRSGERPWKA